MSGVDIHDTDTALDPDDAGQGLTSTPDPFRYPDNVNGPAPGTDPVPDWSVGNPATATDDLRGPA